MTAAAALSGLMGCVTPGDGSIGQSQIEVLARRAARGDKVAQLELGERLETGEGTAADPPRAARLYRQASSFTSGTTFIYLPGVKGKPGMVLPLRRGPDQPGLPEAQYRLGLMYLEGRGMPQDRRRALTLLKTAAKAGFEPAAAKLRSGEQP